MHDCVPFVESHIRKGGIGCRKERVREMEINVYPIVAFVKSMWMMLLFPKNEQKCLCPIRLRANSPVPLWDMLDFERHLFPPRLPFLVSLVSRLPVPSSRISSFLLLSLFSCKRPFSSLSHSERFLSTCQLHRLNSVLVCDVLGVILCLSLSHLLFL